MKIMENVKHEWTFTLSKDSNVQFHTDKAPNAFGRFMQKILLGIYWKKIV
jgi:hypothetical protein